MQTRMEERKYDMMLFMITDMLQEGTHLLFLGAPDVIAQAFNARPDSHHAFLPGILSRKKQVIPALSVFWG
jgi:Inorganic pyrophosphatase/exopolyphosphatase